MSPLVPAITLHAAWARLRRSARGNLGFLALAGLAAIFTPSGARAALSLDEISAYLNSFAAARAEFRQVNADGSTSSGTLYLQRPGRARFEYDPPNEALVIAGGGQVAVFDPVSNQPPEQYPLARTPLKVILARDVDLSRERMVLEVAPRDERTTVLAQDPERPETGRIRLVFAEDPVRLAGWILTDQAGTRTSVSLGGIETGVDLSPRLFSIVFETRDRQGE